MHEACRTSTTMSMLSNESLYPQAIHAGEIAANDKCDYVFNRLRPNQSRMNVPILCLPARYVDCVPI